MEIKVYISLPHNERNCKCWRDIVWRLRRMVDGNRVFISSCGDVRDRGSYHDELTRLVDDVRKIAEVNFVIFGNGWETDRRSRIEHAVAVLYNVPHCGVDEVETFFRNYIADTFKFDENPAEADTDV